MTWTVLQSGLLYHHYDDSSRGWQLAAKLNREDHLRCIDRKAPCVAVVELEQLHASTAAIDSVLGALTGAHLPLVLAGRRYSDAGLLHGPVRNAAWRTVDAKHFGLPQRRSLFIVAVKDIDPAIVFEQATASHTPGLDTGDL